MTTYRAGQRVRIEWPDGDFLEGVVKAQGTSFSVKGKYLDFEDGRTVTILSDPEPTEFGSIVEAGSPIAKHAGKRFAYTSVSGRWYRENDEEYPGLANWSPWASLIDPVIKRVGWEQ